MTPTPATAAGLAAPLERALARHAAELVRTPAVQVALDELGPSHAGLIRDVVPRVVALPALVEVLRRLVAEGVSIRDLAAVLEGLALVPATATRDAATLAEHVRGHLGRGHLRRGGGARHGRGLDRRSDDRGGAARRDRGAMAGRSSRSSPAWPGTSSSRCAPRSASRAWCWSRATSAATSRPCSTPSCRASRWSRRTSCRPG